MVIRYNKMIQFTVFNTFNRINICAICDVNFLTLWALLKIYLYIIITL